MHAAVIKTYIRSALQHFLVRKRSVYEKNIAEFARCPAGRGMSWQKGAESAGAWFMLRVGGGGGADLTL